MSDSMAASQNPIQGSLFGGEKQHGCDAVGQTNTSKTSNDNLSNQYLKDDASLRPRIKKTSKNPNQISDSDAFSTAEIEEPKWSHHNLPNIDDLTPA